jgi:hypothetical protein
MSRGQDRHLPLRHQLDAVEPGQGVERRVHERHVGAPVAQHPFLFARATRQDLDLGGAWLGRVGVEELVQQLVERAGLHRQHHAVTGRTRAVGAPGATRAADGGGGRVESRAAFLQKDFPGPGQRDAAAIALQQCDAKAALELLDRPGQRGLGDAEALGGPAEVQLVGDGDEVPQLAGLHDVHATAYVVGDTCRVSQRTGSVLAASSAREPGSTA